MQRIWDGTRPMLEQWIGSTLVETGLYGIRIYSDGAVLGSRKLLLEYLIHAMRKSDCTVIFSCRCRSIAIHIHSNDPSGSRSRGAMAN
jgi:hypothetical protein